MKPRQDPVSCHLCRSRKLKCSRQQPCTNCIARGVSCVFGARPPTTAPAPPDTAFDTAAILARLQKLEEAVLASKQTKPPAPLTATTPSLTYASPRSDTACAHSVNIKSLEQTGVRQDATVSVREYLLASVVTWKIAVSFHPVLHRYLSSLPLYCPSSDIRASKPNSQ